jgi:hypothetical protein
MIKPCSGRATSEMSDEDVGDVGSGPGWAGPDSEMRQDSSTASAPPQTLEGSLLRVQIGVVSQLLAKTGTARHVVRTWHRLDIERKPRRGLVNVVLAEGLFKLQTNKVRQGQMHRIPEQQSAENVGKSGSSAAPAKFLMLQSRCPACDLDGGREV